jgi:hypothetical protein
MIERTANVRAARGRNCAFGSIHLKEGILFDIGALRFHGGIVALGEEMRPVREMMSS